MAADRASAELIRAIREHDAERVRALLAAGASPEAVEEDTQLAAVVVATDEEQPDIVRALLAAGARPDGAVLDAAHGRAEVLRLLLEAGADPNQRSDYESQTALYCAAAHPDAVAALLDHGADPNVATANGETPLTFCADWGYLASMRLLLAGGADPNHVMRAGEGGEVGFEGSVLCFAAQLGQLDGIEALIAAGADPTWCNRFGRTPASVAFDHRHPDAAAAILAHGAGFTAPVDGLRARLVVSGGRPLDVVLEVQRVEDTPADVVVDDPTSLAWALEADCVEVPPAFGRMDVVGAPRRVTLAPGDLVRWTASHRAAEGEGGGPVDLDLVTAAWRLDGLGDRLALRCAWRGLEVVGAVGR